MDRREFIKRTGVGSAGLAALAGSGCGSMRRMQLPGLGAEPWLEIDHRNLAWNLEQLRDRVAGRPVMAVIKANAYGHGLVETGRFLEKLGVSQLAVGKFREAWELREGGVEIPILNFGLFTREEASEIVRRDISQTVYADDFALLSEAARRAGKQARVHIKVDTGLGRIGVPWHRALPLIERIAATSGIAVEGIFTPFTEDDAYDRTQLERLLELCAQARRKGISLGLRHAASSAGVLSFPEAWLDMVRPGIAIYGQYPSVKEAKRRRIELRPVMSVKTRVMYVKTLRPGESLSYHRAFTARERTRVATLAIGYSDGYPANAAAKASALIAGRRWPSIGLVTSNHMTLDVTGSEDISTGDEAVLLGAQGENEIGCEEIAAWAGTSVYKILIWMSPLLPRKILG
ncbi:MAG: alanine racemase [Planctomycetota bacterium]